MILFLSVHMVSRMTKLNVMAISFIRLQSYENERKTQNKLVYFFCLNLPNPSSYRMNTGLSLGR